MKINITFHFNSLLTVITLVIWCNIFSVFSKPISGIIQIDPLCKFTPKSLIGKPFHKVAETARGEEVHFQFVLKTDYPLILTNFSVKPQKGSETLSHLKFNVCYEGFVGVKCLSKDSGKYSCLPLSHLVPDPIFDYNIIKIHPNNPQPIWLSVHIPDNFPLGTYRAFVTFKGINGKKNIIFTDSLAIKVYPVTIRNEHLNISNQFCYDSGRYGFHQSKWSFLPFESNLWFQYMHETARLLRQAKTNTILLNPKQFIDIRLNYGKYSFDYTRLDRIIRLFAKENVLHNLECSHLGRRIGGWDSNFVLSFPIINNNGEITWNYAPLTDCRVRNFYCQFLPSIHSHLRNTFPNIHYLQHIADEPINENSQSYIEIAKFFKQICQDIILFDAIKTPNVAKYIDIPVPELDVIHENENYFKHLIKSGKQIWFYTCWQPQGNYANRFLEQPLLLVRILHWINFKYHINGYLHWGFNRWGNNNPYQETTQSSGDYTLPGGDSYIIYPSNSMHLFSSLRLVAMRDGINDYNLFKMLSEEHPQLAEKLCSEVIKDWDSYNIDPDHFREVRHKLLEYLSSK